MTNCLRGFIATNSTKNECSSYHVVAVEVEAQQDI